MDPRASHDLVVEMLRCCNSTIDPRNVVQKRATSPNHHDRAKRHGIYFPAKGSFESKWNFADDESTWEFSAPVASYPRCDSTNTVSSSSSTPAQDIVLRYRAGLPPLLRSTKSSDTSSNSDASYRTAPTNASRSSGRSSPVLDDAALNSKVRNRQSRCDALARALKEAMAVMKQHGKGEHDTLVCHRPGCRDTLHGVKALMYHLHIHDIHNDLTCPLCGHQCESDLQLNSHCCMTKTAFRSPPCSPLKDGFRRVLSKLGRCL